MTADREPLFDEKHDQPAREIGIAGTAQPDQGAAGVEAVEGVGQGAEDTLGGIDIVAVP